MERYRVHITDEVLDDLRLRLRHARWPDQINDIGWEQGTELDWLRQLVTYWADVFDWRAWERKLNALEHFTSEGIHFVYQRAKRSGSTPVVLTHGWPSSFLEYVDVLPMLQDFDVIVPSLPGYGFSRRPLERGVNYRCVARRWHGLMTELGYSRYGAGGGDFGAGVATVLALDYPQSVIGIHLTTPEFIPEVDAADLSDLERSYLAIRADWDANERGYSAIQATKPQTLGYGLNDSPVGLAAYLCEKWRSWSDITPSHEFLCATLTLYWATQTITSSMRDYWDNRRYPVRPDYVRVPTAFSVFANETVPEGAPPRSYLERLYNIQRWTVFPQGGHFAAAEVPESVAGELTAFFGSMP